MAVVCNLLVSSRGNLFMREIAELYAAALTGAGAPSTVVVDGVPMGRAGTVDIIVAPHEYFAFGYYGVDRLEHTLSRCAVLTTEQPGSPWWGLQRPAIEAVGLVLDLNALAVRTHAAEGATALHAPVGYHASLDRWGGADHDRPVDVAFLGGATDRRLDVLAGFAPLLSHRDSRLLLHDPAVPVTAPTPWFLTGDDRRDLLATTKILVNVHREATGYFEWIRAIEAFANGAVLLTEPSLEHAPLLPSTHFVQGDPERLPGHATALLADDILRAKVAQAAYDFVRTELDMSALLAATVVPALEDLAEESRAFAPPAVDEPLPTHAHSVPAVPRQTITPPADFESRALAAVKQVLLGQIQLERRLSNLQSQVDRGAANEIDERFTPGWATAQPEVSVVIPLCNYAKTITEAIESVLASRGVELEVIVVEDHSTDDSRQVLEAFIDTHPDAPVLGMFRSANGGLGAARNLGISRARAEHCFLLDADNLVYPAALQKLSAALRSSGAAFAYSIIEVFGTERTLLSARPWDVQSLTRSPYIDAMSLIDRRAWRQVGGFRESSTVLHGWEDYAFWLSLANAGLGGTWVPEPLCRYRRHAASMISTTRLDGLTPLLYLREEYPNLPWP